MAGTPPKTYERFNRLNLYLKTAEEFSSTMPMFVQSDPAPNARLGLFVDGPKTSSSWPGQIYSTWQNTNYTTWENWGHADASGIIASSMRLRVRGTGTIALDDRIPTIIEGGGIDFREATMTLFEKVVEGIEGARTLYLHATTPPEARQSLVIVGGDPNLPVISGILNNRIGLRIRGARKIRTTGRIPVYVSGPSTGLVESALSIYTQGEQRVSSTLNILVDNTYVEQSLNLRIRGYWSTFKDGTIQGSPTENFDTRTFVTNVKSRAGAIPAFDNLPLYLENNKWATGTLNMFTDGFGDIEDRQFLYASGSLGSENRIELAVSGIGGASNRLAMVMGYGYFLSV